jgi:EAL domain-containing protein (putative c-di-GMP-specific phosphodiesterase class I)
LRLSINISPQQFHQKTFVPQVENILQATGVSVTHLTLEVTEGSIIKDIHETIATMSQLQALGIHLSLDDFGTGYSSLAYLKSLPLNELKIDKSFVQDAPNDPKDAALVEAILSVARHFHLMVVAEGIETLTQVRFLQERGCNLYQGYWYGKPVPLEDFAQVYLGDKIQPSLQTSWQI